MTCAFCGKELPAGIRSHCRYCSATCRSKASYHRNIIKRRALARERYHRLLGKEKPAPQTVSCPICCNLFLQRRTNQIYCSVLCRRAAYNARRREARKAAGEVFRRHSAPRLYHDVPYYPFLIPVAAESTPTPEPVKEHRPWILEHRLPTQDEMDALLDRIFAKET